MGKTMDSVMDYETTPFKVSRGSATKISKTEKTRKLQSISVMDFGWAKTKQHRFGLLVTFTIVYVSFSLFGRLIVGLAESLIK